MGGMGGGFGGFGAPMGQPQGAPMGASSGGMKVGTVKVWFEEKGFGFLAQSDGGDDVFCHRNALEDGQALVQGAQVEFEAEWSAQKNKMAVRRCRGAIPAPEGGKGGASAAQPSFGGPMGGGMGGGMCGGMGGGGAPGQGPPGGQTMTGQMQGTVKVWFDDKGFGFIAPTIGGNDVFVHRNGLLDGESLVLGQTVTYVAEWNHQKNKYTATQCSGAVARPPGAEGAIGGMGGGGGFGKGGGGGGMGGGDRFSPYGGGASAMPPMGGGLGDLALQQASMQAQQALQMQMGGGMQQQMSFTSI